MRAPTFASVRDEYSRLWAGMIVAPAHAASITGDARRLLADKPRYQSIDRVNGVPWFVVALIDCMEAGGGCKRHLHNGDSLSRRTVSVPRGRLPAPSQPPFSWEQSAFDALAYDHLAEAHGPSPAVNAIGAWPVERLCYVLESYNGWGYRGKRVNTPYLWNWSNQHAKGKYVRDGVYDPNAISEQPGAMPILKAMMALDHSVSFAGTRETRLPKPAAGVSPIPVSPAATAPTVTAAPHKPTLGEEIVGEIHHVEAVVESWLAWPKAL